MATATLAVLFTALIGFAHTRPGRPLLVVLGPLLGMGPARGARAGASCPFGYDKAASPAQKEAARRQFAAGHRGEGSAQARPALGFALDRTTKAEVLAWGREHGVRCAKPRSGGDLECSEVPEALLPAPFRGAKLTTLWLNFGEGDRLTSLVGVRRERSAQPISAAFAAVRSALDEEAGPAAAADGTGSAAELSAGLLRQASAEYRFRNYYALARATNMGDGFVLTEEYRSLTD